MDRNKDGYVALTYEMHTCKRMGMLTENRALGIFWKLARIGERLSPYVAICCVFMAGSVFVGQ
jgi:hypothetical protein